MDNNTRAVMPASCRAGGYSAGTKRNSLGGLLIVASPGEACACALAGQTRGSAARKPSGKKRKRNNQSPNSKRRAMM